MIRKLKTQLFKSPLFLTLTLAVPLAVFFVFATYFDSSFFVFLAAGFVLSLFFLIPIRGRSARKQSITEIQIQDINERVNLVEAEIEQEMKAIDSFQGKIVDASQLKVLTEKLSMCLTLDDTTKTLATEVGKLFGSKETTIILYLFHSKTGELGITTSQRGQMRVNIKSKKGDEFDQWVVKTMRSLLIEDAKSDYRFDVEKIVAEDARPIRSLISVPFISGNKTLGILRIDSPAEYYFKVEDLRFLTTIGDLGAVAIENAQLYQRVQELAIRDSLTNLYLRRYLMERFPEEIIRHVRSKQPLSFLMIDIDNFKRYNDKFGHQAGDIVLRALATILSDSFTEPGSLICRYGGEEFAILLPHCAKKKAFELADMVRKKVEMQDVVLRREKTKISVSIGTATFPHDAGEKEELIQKADDALYQAKKKGRNRVCQA